MASHDPRIPSVDGSGPSSAHPFRTVVLSTARDGAEIATPLVNGDGGEVVRAGTPVVSPVGEVTGDPRLVADLSRTVAYPEPRPQEVTVAATHASWVFLAGDEVWKIKRPVNYGFLDYSDAEKRRRCCEDEVRLGTRLAPDVYRRVEPVFLGPDGFSFVGPGSVVDAAVRMRRLPEEESALNLVRAGHLDPGHIRTLCDRLADFYAMAARTDGLRRPGHP